MLLTTDAILKRIETKLYLSGFILLKPFFLTTDAILKRIETFAVFAELDPFIFLNHGRDFKADGNRLSQFWLVFEIFDGIILTTDAILKRIETLHLRFERKGVPPLTTDAILKRIETASAKKLSSLISFFFILTTDAILKRIETKNQFLG